MTCATDDLKAPIAVQIRTLLGLLRFSSAALPTGSFAYSYGLESLVSRERICSEQDARNYLCSLLTVVLGGLDVPRLVRMHRAFALGDTRAATRESAWLYAARESREAQAQERQMARALLRIGEHTGVLGPTRVTRPQTYAEIYALVAVCSGVDEVACATGYCFTWAEAHSNVLAKLIPLGPMAMQGLLASALELIPAVVARGCAMSEDEIGGATPGLALAMAMHETDYSRIFRS